MHVALFWPWAVWYKKEEERRRIGVFSIIIIIATCSKVHNAEQWKGAGCVQCIRKQDGNVRWVVLLIIMTMFLFFLNQNLNSISANCVGGTMMQKKKSIDFLWTVCTNNNVLQREKVQNSPKLDMSKLSFFCSYVWCRCILSSSSSSLVAVAD